MNKKTTVPLGSIEVEVKLTDKQRRDIKAIANKFADEIQEVISGPKKSDEPEIRIIEPGALPAGLYMRDSVLAAVHAEIIKDYKATGQVAPGAELIGQEEESNGETKEISSPDNDSDDGGNGQATPGDSGDNGSPESSRGEDHPGDSAQESSDDGSGGDSQSSGDKPGEK